ncbi:MAG: EF-hand domain-containing protein [Deltaproteobacteria bacterium]|nr:EF-hand domain-containing protein [Deltaproteobacteria bacterium]
MPEKRLSHLSPDVRAQLKAVFQEFDLDGDGFLSAEELRAAMVRFDEHLTEGRPRRSSSGMTGAATGG